MMQTLKEKGIHSVSANEVEEYIEKEYSFAATASDEKYGRGRGAAAVLEPGKDYAELPGFDGHSPRQIIESLPAGGAVLDVGCGYGELGVEIIQTINPGVEVHGFDAQAQKGQERLKKVVIGNVDALSPHQFDGRLFDLVISSALLYHLPDYWGAILRMAHLLKPGGILLASTLPRIVRDNETGESHYFRNRNVFDVQGQLVAPEELVEQLNSHNQHFKLEYGLATADLSAVGNVGGQLSGTRLSGEGNLDLSRLFYCRSQDSLGYVSAPHLEYTQLERTGFVNVMSRINSQ